MFVKVCRVLLSFSAWVKKKAFGTTLVTLSSSYICKTISMAQCCMTAKTTSVGLFSQSLS